MDFEELKKYADSKINFIGKNVVEADCDIVVYLLDNCEIKVSDRDVFFGKINCEGIVLSVMDGRSCKYDEKILRAGLQDGVDSLAYTGWRDFSHTTTMWEDVLTLGFVGIENRIERYKEKEKDPDKKAYFSNLSRVWKAVLRFVERAAEISLNNDKKKMAQGLFALAVSPPSTLFEAMQTIIIYYILQMFFDGTYLRTLGRLDRSLLPFWEKEPESVGKQLLLDFLHEIDDLKAPSNMPFAIGGRNDLGQSAINGLSFALIEAYRKAHTSNTKFHILYTDDMPTRIIEDAFEAIREGNNSIVFMNDRVIVNALLKMGEDYADAVDYHVVGCYECGGKGELACSCNGRVNIPKAIEVALSGGKDMLTGKLIGLENDGYFPTFDSFFSEVKRQLCYFADCAIKCTDLYEVEYKNQHSAPILSATYPTALEKGGDLYCDYTAKYNNSSINAIGLGTAVDALFAIKKAVYDDKIIDLKRLTQILVDDWKDNEILRLTMKNKYDKWGMGVKEVDKIGIDIIDVLSERINGRSNKKGGIYRLGTFSINWRWEFGEKTAASADGRKARETLSQNTSATFGADRNGATGHLISVASIDATKTPNASIIDVDLHSSAVAGENGISGLISSLKGYFDLGGYAVHYNILNTETLKKAYICPDEYPNLQVRLCGWNVLFSSLTKREQEEFIARSEKN